MYFKNLIVGVSLIKVKKYEIYWLVKICIKFKFILEMKDKEIMFVLEICLYFWFFNIYVMMFEI